MRDILFYSHRTELKEFEEIGETELRYKIAHGSFFGNRQLAEEWLRQKESERSLALLYARDERESEMLNIAKSARSDARDARIAAIIAAAIAAIATITAAYITVSTKTP